LRTRLHGTPPLALPRDVSMALVGSSKVTQQGANLMRELSADTIAGVQRLASAHGATPFMVLLACSSCCCALLQPARHCAGHAIANRLRTDTEDLVGTMVNTLVLRTDLSGDPSFVALLLRVRETALQAYAHQNLPYERLVERAAR